MKKILISVFCLLMAVAMLAACSGKKVKNDENNENKQEQESASDSAVIEIPEEQLFEVEIDMDSEETALKITGYTGEEEDLVIPATLLYPDEEGKTLVEYPVVSIGEAAFLGNETIKKVTVPEGVTAIKTGAFQSCSALTDVVLPEGLEKIGENAFENSNLTNINIPSTVTSIGAYAFSTKLNPTPWYKAQTANNVIVGDGILLKYNGRGNVTYGDEVKHVAYYAFQSPGNINVKFSADLESFDPKAVYETEGNYLINFMVPYKSQLEKLIAITPYAYTVHGVPAVTGNPFKWEFNNAAELNSWSGANLDISFAPEGAIHGKATGNDYQFVCNDKINLPAEYFSTMVIRMKHNTGAAFEGGSPQNNIQVYFNNGSGLSEDASVKVDVLPTSNGEYVEYTLDMSANTAWKDNITFFRIDTMQGLEGDFWLDSVEFIPSDSSFDFNTLLKPITKYVPTAEDPHKYKFEQESKATAWAMEGFEYSYAPIAVDGDNDSIHGILDASVESSITSPVVNVPAEAYRKLVVRMRGTFDNDATLKVYFDNGNGFSEEAVAEVNVTKDSGEEKIEYSFDVYKNENWNGTIKQIKVVLPEAVGGEFWIDKVEFKPEEKLTKASFIDMLYKSDYENYASGESIFLDVVPYDSYHNAVVWAVQNGFANRVDNNMFYPDKLITEAEYVEMLNKYAALKTVELSFASENAAAPVYKMDAENAINSIVAVLDERRAAEITPSGNAPVTNTNTNGNTGDTAEPKKASPLPWIIVGAVAVVVIAAGVVVFLKKKKRG